MTSVSHKKQLVTAVPAVSPAKLSISPEYTLELIISSTDGRISKTIQIRSLTPPVKLILYDNAIYLSVFLMRSIADFSP